MPKKPPINLEDVGVFLPHWLSGLTGHLIGRPLTTADLAFHVIDGIIKLAFILLYIWGISLFKEIRRVFQYHGAEHKSICAYEAGEPLDLDHARRHCTCHPRCGTSFILVVLLVSLVIFTIFFPLAPPLTKTGFLNNFVQVLVKVALMFPIAALAYEIIRWGGRHAASPLAKALLWSGLFTQRLTALEPDDSMPGSGVNRLESGLGPGDSGQRPLRLVDVGRGFRSFSPPNLFAAILATGQ